MYSPNLVGAVIGFDADVVEKACADGVIPAVKIFDEWRISEQIVSAICNYGISTPSITTSTAKPDAEQNDAVQKPKASAKTCQPPGKKYKFIINSRNIPLKHVNRSDSARLANIIDANPGAMYISMREPINNVMKSHVEFIVFYYVEEEMKNTIVALLEAHGIGFRYYCYTPKHASPRYTIRVSARSEILKVIRAIRPYLQNRVASNLASMMLQILNTLENREYTAAYHISKKFNEARSAYMATGGDVTSIEKPVVSTPSTPSTSSNANPVVDEIS